MACNPQKRIKKLSKAAGRLLEELESMGGKPIKVRGRKWDAANELGQLGMVEWAPGGKGLLLKLTSDEV